MGTMVRTQVQLTKDQSAYLRRRAAEEGVSLAQIIRECVERERDLAAADREEIRRRALAASGAFHGGPRDLARRHDDYLLEVYGE